MGVLQRSTFSIAHLPVLQRLKQALGFWLVASMLLVNLGNYGFAIVLGRGLGPQAYAEVNLIITCFALATLLSSMFQIYAANACISLNNHAQLRRLRQIAWGVGAASAGVCTGLAAFWQSQFHTSPIPLLILGLGLGSYYALGVERGIMQSQAAFGRLALNSLLEMLIRLIGAMIVVSLSLGVTEASVALTSSLLGAWWFSRSKPTVIQVDSVSHQTPSLWPIGLRLAGQGVLLNSDIVLVTLWFSGQIAGQYAALALIGRIGLFVSSTIATLFFAKLLRADQSKIQQREAFWQSLGITTIIGIVFSLACWAMPDLIVQALFGSAYLPIVSVLWRYAAIASGYALVNLLVSYQLAQQRQAGVWLILGAGSTQIVALGLFHQTINHVLGVQAGIMLALLVFVGLSEWLARQKTALNRSDPARF